MEKSILSYHVYTIDRGGLWLSDDEKTWSKRFTDSASFNDAELAADIGERERGEMTVYVFACMGG